MFAHNGAGGAESKTMFCRVRHVAVPGANSAVYDSLVLGDGRRALHRYSKHVLV